MITNVNDFLSTLKPRTPVNVELLESYLEGHPDSHFVTSLCSGLREGFRIGYSGPRTHSFYPNLRLANLHPDILEQNLLTFWPFDLLRGRHDSSCRWPTCMAYPDSWPLALRLLSKVHSPPSSYHTASTDYYGCLPPKPHWSWELNNFRPMEMNNHCRTRSNSTRSPGARLFARTVDTKKKKKKESLYYFI